MPSPQSIRNDFEFRHTNCALGLWRTVGLADPHPNIVTEKLSIDAKIVQAERKEKSLLDFLSRGAAYFMRKNIFRDIVRISKINRYFCIID